MSPQHMHTPDLRPQTYTRVVCVILFFCFFFVFLLACCCCCCSMFTLSRPIEGWWTKSYIRALKESFLPKSASEQTFCSYLHTITNASCTHKHKSLGQRHSCTYILHTKSHTHIYICFTQCVDDAKRRACKAPNILMYTCTIRTCSIYGLCVRARHEALPRDDVILISKLKVKKAKALGMNIIATDSRKKKNNAWLLRVSSIRTTYFSRTSNESICRSIIIHSEWMLYEKNHRSTFWTHSNQRLSIMTVLM